MLTFLPESIPYFPLNSSPTPTPLFEELKYERTTVEILWLGQIDFGGLSG